jgi:hypothetical protein
MLNPFMPIWPEGAVKLMNLYRLGIATTGATRHTGHLRGSPEHPGLPLPGRTLAVAGIVRRAKVRILVRATIDERDNMVGCAGHAIRMQE